MSEFFDFSPASLARLAAEDAARALADTDFDAEEIVRRSMQIAGDICVYTNGNLTVETIKG